MSKLEDVKVGDLVATLGRMDQAVRIDPVNRVTATQIILERAYEHQDDRRFRRKDGFEIGASDDWNKPRIVPATDEHRAQIQHRRNVNFLRSLDWSSVPADLVAQITDLYRAAVKP